MKSGPVIIDSGPLVALLNPRDQFHRWTLEVAQQYAPPWLVCESVVAEVMTLLPSFTIQDALYAMLQRQSLVFGFRMSEEWPALQALMRKYQELPMSMPDAALVRMSELHEAAHVLTFDTDFQIYRRFGRRKIPLIAPFN